MIRFRIITPGQEKKRERKMINWSALPQEILRSISLHIDNPFDLIHFRSVCSWWRSSSVSRFRPIPSLRCPLPLDDRVCGDDCHILRSRVYLFKSNSAPARYWLLNLQEKEENGELVLHNFFIRRNSSEWGCVYPSVLLDLLNCQVIELAQEHLAVYTYWYKPLDYVGQTGDHIGFMQLGAKNNKFMVLGLLMFQGLAMYSSVEEQWTKLQTKPNSYFAGIVWFNCKFYAVDDAGTTTVVEPSLEVTTFHQSKPCDKTMKRWLVKSREKLLLVKMCSENRQYIPDFREKKVWFEILELDEENNEWYQVQDVGGHVLFLANYCSFSCLASEIPGFRPNSIIFDHNWLGGDNPYESIHVFDLEKKEFRTLIDIPEYIDLFKTPLGWIISNAA